MQHLPVLPIVIPLISAPLCVLMRSRKLVTGYAIVVCWAVFALACVLLGRVMDGGTQVYRLGGWAAPYGIEYRIDTLSMRPTNSVMSMSSTRIPNHFSQKA